MELKVIDRTDRGVTRLNAALTIYRDTILPEAQNPERQILYWIEHSKDIPVDKFCCFALVDEGEVIGYLQYSYFGEEHIFFFEYLCIRGGRRTGLIPNHALKKIEEHLAESYGPQFTIVFEIARRRGENGEWEADNKLIPYFKRLGFRTVDFDYHYPILQSYDGHTSYPADLMVSLPDNRREVSAEQMRTILRCLYFKHYLRWDRPFLDPLQFTSRERLINELYSREVSRIGGNDGFNTRGDDRRSQLLQMFDRRAPIRTMLKKIFAPKMPRVLMATGSMVVVQWALGSAWALIPFIPAVAAIYCLAEDSENSRKLFTVVISKFRLGRLRQSQDLPTS